jgi:hypothetical protein
MNLLALTLAAAAWGCLWLAPRGTVSRLLQFLVFGSIGAVCALAGGLSYWWDAGMRPDQKSPLLLICGVLMLASQAGTVLRALLDEDTPSWPRGRDRKP